MILRRGYTPKGTFGVLTCCNQEFTTLERPWANNSRFMSCIPEGVYELVPNKGKKWTSYALVNEHLGVFQHPRGEHVRDSIVIHPANTADELSGCIAVGHGVGIVSYTWAILNSRGAYGELMSLLQDLPVRRLTITHEAH